MNEFEKWAWKRIQEAWNNVDLNKMADECGFPYVYAADEALMNSIEITYGAIGYTKPFEFMKMKLLVRYGDGPLDWTWWYYPMDIQKKTHDGKFRDSSKIRQWIWPKNGNPKGTWSYLTVDAALACLSWKWYLVTEDDVLDFIKENPQIGEFFRTIV